MNISILRKLLFFQLIVLLLALCQSAAVWSAPTFVNAADPTLPDVARGVPKGGALNVFELELDQEGTVTLELERFDVFAADAVLTVVWDTGPTTEQPPNDAYFRGWANHDPDSIVMLAISEQGDVRGVITGASGAWLLGPGHGSGNRITSRKVDLEAELADRTFSCGVTSPSVATTQAKGADAGFTQAVSSGAMDVQADGIPTNVQYTAHMIVDSDYEYYQIFGDPADAFAYMGDLFAYTSSVYEREINTNLLIIQARLFASSFDPYDEPDTGCDGDGSLDEVQAEWSGVATPRTLVHLLSGKPSGGCAYVGVLCSQDSGYGSSMGITSGFDVDNPDVIWETMVVAHEIGHNFNSPHTHGYCGIGGIDDPIDICAEVEEGCNTDDYVEGALPGLNSLTGGLAGDGTGTLMSYCHLPTGGFGNVSFTFGKWHDQGVAAFRVTDRMAAHVADSASCMAVNYSGADLRVFKDCKPDDPVLLGGTGICTIVVENLGPSMALGVTATDNFVSDGTFNFGTITAEKGDFMMPAGTCAADSPNPQDMQGEVNCELGELAAGHEVTIRIPVTAASPQNVNDRVTVDSDSPDHDQTNNLAEDELNFIAAADLQVFKDCKPDGELLAGENGTCTIKVTNLGPSSATNVEVTDTHVSNVPFTIDGFTPGPATCNSAGGVVTCNYASIAAGDSRTIVVTIAEDEPMDINDQAVATSSTADPDSANNAAADGLHIIGLADVSITKSDSPDPVDAGTNLTYTLTISNSGPSTATNVVVQDVVPAGTSMVSVAASQGSCVAGVPGDATQPTVCTLGSLASGANATVTIVVAVLPNAVGPLINTATVVSDTLDSNNGNNSATASTAVNSNTGLSIVKTDDPDPVAAGALLSYRITVANSGPSTATQLSLIDTLPAGVSWDSTEVEEGSGNCILSAASEVTCDNIGDLAPGERFRVVIRVLVDPSVPDGTVITNEVNLLEDDVLVAEDSEDTTVIAVADLWVDKTGNFPTGNSSGTILYYITVHNAPGCSADDPQVCGSGGPSDALGIVVTDTLPSTNKKFPVEFVSENCVYDKPTHTVTCTEPVLAAGDSVTFEIQATAKGSIGDITNVVDVSSSTTDPSLGNNHDELLMTVQGGTGNPGGPGGGRGNGGNP